MWNLSKVAGSCCILSTLRACIFVRAEHGCLMWHTCLVTLWTVCEAILKQLDVFIDPRGNAQHPATIACDEGCLLCKTDVFQYPSPVIAIPLAGKGSTFTIRLPVNPSTPKVSSEFSRDNDGQGNGQFMGSSSPRATVEAGSWLVVLITHVISAVFRCVLPCLSCHAVTFGCAVIM